MALSVACLEQSHMQLTYFVVLAPSKWCTKKTKLIRINWASGFLEGKHYQEGLMADPKNYQMYATAGGFSQHATWLTDKIGSTLKSSKNTFLIARMSNMEASVTDLEMKLTCFILSLGWLRCQWWGTTSSNLSTTRMLFRWPQSKNISHTYTNIISEH